MNKKALLLSIFQSIFIILFCTSMLTLVVYNSIIATIFLGITIFCGMVYAIYQDNIKR